MFFPEHKETLIILQGANNEQIMYSLIKVFTYFAKRERNTKIFDSY